jgi:hypothetical protein
MAEVQVAGVTYQINRLSAFAQFHIARRLTPFVSSLGPALKLLPTPAAAPALATVNGQAVEAAPTTEPPADLEVVSRAIMPIADALAHMSDSDANYILNGCLDACFRRMGNQVFPIRTPGPLEAPSMMMYEDIDMLAMLQLVWAVIQENMARFFPAAQVSSSGQPNQGAPPS